MPSRFGHSRREHNRIRRAQPSAKVDPWGEGKEEVAAGAKAQAAAGAKAGAKGEVGAEGVVEAEADLMK